MIDIFGKKKIAKLESEIGELKKDLERLTRIYQNAKDEPSFKIVSESFIDPYGINDPTYVLYLYINKQEYIMPLPELRYYTVDRDSACLTVNDNYATFTIDCVTFVRSSYTCKFIIDYLHGKYVCMNENKKEVK